MGAQLNHTIVWSSDQTKSARFLTEMLGRPAPTRVGHFDVVELDNGVSLDFANAEGPIRPQRYAFLISEADATLFSAASASGVSTTGPIRCAAAPARSIKTTVGEESIFQTRTVITWKCSPDPTEAASAEPSRKANAALRNKVSS